jgi:hypothetical protein
VAACGGRGVDARRRGVLATGIASGGTAKEWTGVVRPAFSASADAKASARFLPGDSSRASASRAGGADPAGSDEADLGCAGRADAVAGAPLGARPPSR